MTPESQRIALAEWAGWKWRESCETAFGASMPLQKWFGPDGKVAALPDTSSLDVLHEMEKRLEPDSALRVKWLNTLREVCGRKCEKNKAGTPLVSDWHLATADDDQRREALLRTLGLWREE